MNSSMKLQSLSGRLGSMTQISPLHRMVGLDLLRFGSALSVMLYHFLYAGPKEGYYRGISALDITSAGWLGVDVFFVISGLVISLSIENRNASQFLVARFLRLFPAFFVCSLLGTLAWAILENSFTNRILRWAAGLTFFPEAFGEEFHLSVYWTLQIEVIFYFLVFITIYFKVWKNNLTIFMLVWLILSVCNEFVFNNLLLRKIFDTSFAGHFCMGIIIYQILRGSNNSFTALVFILSYLLFYNYDINHYDYINHTFHQNVPPHFIIFIPLIIFTLVYAIASIKSVPIPASLCAGLGLSTYPFYLLHADIGFYSRTVVDRVLFQKYHFLERILTPWVMMTIAIISSIIVSFLFAKHIEPFARNVFVNILNYFCKKCKRTLNKL